MKKLTTLIIILTFTLIGNQQSHAQLFSIGAGGGLSQVLGPEGYTNSTSEGGAEYSSEINIGVMAKLGLPLLPITPRALLLYHNFSGSGDQPILGKSSAINNTIDYSQSVVTAGLGVQYQFIPVPAGFDPYLALDLLYNNFGKTEIKTDAGTTNGETFSRFGLGLGIGSTISIIPVVNLEVLASYQMLNLTGKEDGEETVSVLVLDAFIMFSFL